MFDMPFITEDETEYTLTIGYTYNHRPEKFAADPNDCCDNESELDMKRRFICPVPSRAHTEEINDSWDSREDDSLYNRAASLALEDFFRGFSG